MFEKHCRYFQILEMPLGVEESIMKNVGNDQINGYAGGKTNSNQGFHGYLHNNVSDEGDFSIEEDMYAISGQTRAFNTNNK